MPVEMIDGAVYAGDQAIQEARSKQPPNPMASLDSTTIRRIEHRLYRGQPSLARFERRLDTIRLAEDPRIYRYRVYRRYMRMVMCRTVWQYVLETPF